jgi:DNA-binding MarR family transcriptional regulator
MMLDTSSIPGTADADLADALRLVIGRLARRLRQQALGDMTPSQRSVLSSLGRHGPMRMGELAAVEGISGPSLTGIVGRLEDRGFVVRRDDPDDARSTIAAATDRGLGALEEARRERTAFLVKRLARLDESERETVAGAVALLGRMVEDE